MKKYVREKEREENTQWLKTPNIAINILHIQ
jgi:hypothetical protein